jgi:hypothetical protein
MSRSPSSPPGLSDLAKKLGDERAAPDLSWVAHLTGADLPTVRRTLAELVQFADLEEGIHRTLLAGGRDFYAAINAPFELYALVRLARPAHIVEVGVSSGISSSHFLLGLRANGNGSLHSIDLPTPQRGAKLAEDESPVSIPPGRSSGWAVPAELRGGWDLRLGPSQALLPKLSKELPRIDIFLHDDLHTPEHLAWELRTIRPRLAPGSIVLADNTEWTGNSFPEFARELGAKSYPKSGRDLMGLRVPESSSAPKRAVAARRRSSR